MGKESDIGVIQGGAKEWGHKRITIILSDLNRFTKFFSLEDSLVNLQLTGYKQSHHSLHTVYVATLPCET